MPRRAAEARTALMRAGSTDMQIDLEPHEWRSSPRAGERIFGPGLPGAIAYLAGFAISVTVVYFVLH